MKNIVTRLPALAILLVMAACSMAPTIPVGDDPASCGPRGGHWVHPSKITRHYECNR